MFSHQGILLIGGVLAVGVLHTLVPDHWMPIALIARQRHWSSLETARAAGGAGLGHTLSTLAIGLLIWVAGLAFAVRFGRYVSLASSAALILFGTWTALGAWRDAGAGHPRAEELPEVAPSNGSKSRMALMLILGSSPMIEGIPAFFAAARLGATLVTVMSFAFAAATITTYISVCVYSAKALKRLTFGPIERYGEVLSGAVIVALGFIFLWLPM